VTAHGIHAQAYDLGVALFEFVMEAGHTAQLGSADRGEIFGMRKENGPTVADPLVEVDGAVGCFGSKVGRRVVDPEGHAAFLLSFVFKLGAVCASLMGNQCKSLSR
jgi:hypothetical protein